MASLQIEADVVGRDRASRRSTRTAPSEKTARYRKAAVGEKRLQSSPAMPEAMILPKLWTVASSPNADPRRSLGARVATGVCSLVSMKPMARPATMKEAANNTTLGVLTAKAQEGHEKEEDTCGQDTAWSPPITHTPGRQRGDGGALPHKNLPFSASSISFPPILSWPLFQDCIFAHQLWSRRGTWPTLQRKKKMFHEASRDEQSVASTHRSLAAYFQRREAWESR